MPDTIFHQEATPSDSTQLPTIFEEVRTAEPPQTIFDEVRARRAEAQTSLEPTIFDEVRAEGTVPTDTTGAFAFTGGPGAPPRQLPLDPSELTPKDVADTFQCEESSTSPRIPSLASSI